MVIAAPFTEGFAAALRTAIGANRSSRSQRTPPRQSCRMVFRHARSAEQTEAISLDLENPLRMEKRSGVRSSIIWLEM